jgi:hypothetical protein
MPQLQTKLSEAAAAERMTARLKVREAAKNQAVIAAIRTYRADLETALAIGDLPKWFERLLGKCKHDADIIAGNAGVRAVDVQSHEAGIARVKASQVDRLEARREAFEAAYVPAFAETFPSLLANALKAYDSIDPTD